MKTIYLKVTLYHEGRIDRYLEQAPNFIGLGDGESVKEIHLPTDENINAKADEWQNDSQDEFADANFEGGALWLKSEIEKQ